MSLKPPATLRPRNRRSSEHGDLGILDFALQRFPAEPGHDGGVAQLGAFLASNGSRMTNIEPKLELVAESTNDMPERLIVWATPGVSRVIFSTSPSASSKALGAMRNRGAGC